MTPICTGCNKRADELEEYIGLAAEENMPVNQYVIEEEGTYNPSNGHYLCTPCYIKAGMPSNHFPQRWVAP